MRDNNFLVTFGWMKNRLGLKGCTLRVFALIYGFSQDGESRFSGSYNYIAEMCDCCRDTAIDAVKKLIGIGFIEKVVTQNQENTYVVCMDMVDALLRAEPPTKNSSRKIRPAEINQSENPTSSSRKIRPHNNIYNNINNINTNKTNSSEDKSAEPTAILLPLNNGKEYAIPMSLIEEYAVLYPAVDVMQELRKMRAWLISNPKHRKTKTGILRFINTWLSKEQDKGRNSYHAPTVINPAHSTVPSPELAAEIEREEREWNIT